MHAQTTALNKALINKYFIFDRTKPRFLKAVIRVNTLTFMKFAINKKIGVRD